MLTQSNFSKTTKAPFYKKDAKDKYLGFINGKDFIIVEEYAFNPKTKLTAKLALISDSKRVFNLKGLKAGFNMLSLGNWYSKYNMKVLKNPHYLVKDEKGTIIGHNIFSLDENNMFADDMHKETPINEVLERLIGHRLDLKDYIEEPSKVAEKALKKANKPTK